MAARRRRAAADDSQLSLDFLFGGDPTIQGPLSGAAVSRFGRRPP